MYLPCTYGTDLTMDWVLKYVNVFRLNHSFHYVCSYNEYSAHTVESCSMHGWGTYVQLHKASRLNNRGDSRHFIRMLMCLNIALCTTAIVNKKCYLQLISLHHTALTDQYCCVVQSVKLLAKITCQANLLLCTLAKFNN